MSRDDPPMSTVSLIGGTAREGGLVAHRTGYTTPDPVSPGIDRVHGLRTLVLKQPIRIVNHRAKNASVNREWYGPTRSTAIP